MRADDGDNKPHPAAKNPQAPCNDDGPGLPHWFQNLPGNRPPDGRIPRRPPPQQVGEAASYAVAGKILLAAAGALAGVLLALVAMYLYNAARRRRHADAGAGLGRRRLGRSPAIGAGHDRDDGASASATPHGLDPAVLRALPVVVVAQGGGASDCAVCLGELQTGEKARALPRCAHVFHADCIDAWFRGNATCPLCRADVVTAPGAEDAETVAPPPDEVRINVGVGGADAPKAASTTAMGRLPSGTDLDKTRRAFFASTRSTSF